MSWQISEDAVNPDGNKGDFPTEIMIDGVESSTRIAFYASTPFSAVISAYLLIIPDATGNLRWSATTTFGKVCSNEDYDTHTGSVAETTTGVTIDKIECLDISAALTGLAVSDIVGLEFVRCADDGLDTIDANVHFLGVIITVHS